MNIPLCLLFVFVTTSAFVFPSQQKRNINVVLHAEISTSAVQSKDIVKIFGRLAEKYIMLDDSGGMCCYSGCSDCEFRLPGGGYKMADQTSSRPKWIPVYENRKFEALEKEHTTQWSTQLFTNGPAVDKETFVQRLTSMTFVPPLGGPYLSASAGNSMEDSTIFAANALFDLLMVGSNSQRQLLTRHRMSTRLKELSNGEEGVTWGMLETAMMSFQP